MRHSNMRLVLFALCLARLARTDQAAKCGGTFRGYQYTISSPNYPHDYPHGRHCVYELQGEPSADCQQEFHLQFLHFNVKSSENCRDDYLQVGNRYVFCGSISGLRKFTGNNNTLSVTFHSDGSGADKGFKILVTTIPCYLKLNLLNNHSSKEITEEFKSRPSLNDIRNSAYRRGIRGGGDSNVNDSANRLNSSTNTMKSNSSTAFSQFSQQNPSVDHPQIDFSPGDKSEINSLLPPVQSSPPAIDPSQNNSHITTYLFLPPKESDPVGFNSLRTVGQDVVTPPASDILPPNANPFKVQFSNKNGALATGWDKSSSFVAPNHQKKVSLPARSYGEPGFGVVNYDLQVANDCDKNKLPVLNWDEGANSVPTEGVHDHYSGQEIPIVSSSRNIYDPLNGPYDPLNTGYINPGYVNPGYINPGYANSGNANPGYISPGYISSGYGNPGYENNGYINPTYGNPDYENAGYANPGYVNPGYVNPGYVNPGYVNPGYVNPGYNPGYNQGGECCRAQSSRRFSITSPGFPRGSSSNYICRHTITKSSPDICQLRLNFRYFNFGIEDQVCQSGFVEIDGRKYCGCKTGLNLLIPFSNLVAKTILVTSSGYPRNRFSGFLINVIQEPCNIPGVSYPGYPQYPEFPQNPYDPLNPVSSGYLRRRDISSSNSTIVPSPNDPNPLIRNKRDLGYSYPRPSAPFTSSESGKYHERFFAGSCQNRVFLDWVIASKETLFSNVRCIGQSSGAPGIFGRRYLPPNSRKDENSLECEEINVSHGTIRSPSYPNYYPENVKKCYRFNKAPNACKLEVYIRDFDLETSQGCSKDSLSFNDGNSKHCGRSLNDFKTIFDLTHGDPVEVYFVSDSHGTGRGFDIDFSQLPCEATANF